MKGTKAISEMADCEPWTRKIDRKSQGHILLPKSKFQAFTEEITLNSLGILFYFILFFTFSPNWACIYLFFKLLLFFYCGGFCHALKWNSHAFTCVPHPDPPSHLSLHPLPLGLPSAPGPSACLMHTTWAGWSVSRSTVYHSQYMEAS